MSQLADLLTDPIIRKALFLVSPEAGMIVEAAAVIFRAVGVLSNSRERELMELLDKRFALLTKELAQKDISPVAKRELEIRLHELLYILTRWKK